MLPVCFVRKIFSVDKEPVLRFLRTFFRDEPLNLAANLLESRCVELEDYVVSSLEHGVSIAAFDNNTNIVGVMINGIAKRDEIDEDKSSECLNPNFARIMKVWWHLDNKSEYWKKLPATCHTVMQLRIAATHHEWRKQGVGRVLVKETERIAKSVGAGAMCTATTSAFSAAGVEQLGYKCIYRVLYKDLPYAPQPEPPHLEGRVYIKEL